MVAGAALCSSVYTTKAATFCSGDGLLRPELRTGLHCTDEETEAQQGNQLT